MRQIEFRGKQITGEWVYGYLHKVNGKLSIQDKYESDILIVPETVGQHTGLKDRDGNKIFEGDIVTDNYSNAVVKYYEDVGRYLADFSPYEESPQSLDNKVMWATIKGNIHDNPELLQ